MEKIEVTSPAFRQGHSIPRKHTCQGQDVNPEIDIKGVPAEAKSFALVMDDPDAPRGTWVHWVAWNIPVTAKIGEGQSPGVQGMNSAGKHQYHGPCPPSGTHRYYFKIYALDTELDLPPETGKAGLENAIRGRIIAAGELMGTYRKE